MKTARFGLCFALVILTGAALAANAAQAPIVVMPGHETWAKQPGGYLMAPLYGNPAKPGFYVVRLKTGANWKFPAHYHPGRENVTVISGVFYAGLGRKWDNKKLVAYPAGSFISLPAKTPHFAMTKQPAIIELSGTEPLQDVMIK